MKEQIYYIEQSRHKNDPVTAFSFFTEGSLRLFIQGIEFSKQTNRVVVAYFRIKLKPQA